MREFTNKEGDVSILTYYTKDIETGKTTCDENGNRRITGTMPEEITMEFGDVILKIPPEQRDWFEIVNVIFEPSRGVHPKKMKRFIAFGKVHQGLIEL